MSDAKTKAVLWDFDGVLFDTGEFHYQSWFDTLHKYGIPFDRHIFRQVFGMNNTDTLHKLLGDNTAAFDIQKIGDEKEELFRQMARHTSIPLPGVESWLGRLKQQGFLQVIASSAPEENLTVLLQSAGIRNYFHAVVSGAQLPGKPEPFVFLNAARAAGAEPAHCVVVEDAVAGVTAARRAGMPVIAVTNTNSAEALAQADLIVNSLEQLPEDAFLKLLGLAG